jgi:4-carboxymuconolactone decarboxylase
MNDERYERGLKNYNQVMEGRPQQVITEYGDIAPDFARYVVEFAYGDIYARPTLDIKTREMLAIASLATLGYAQGQLRTHIHGALNNGCTHEEVIEILLQVAIYAGFPAVFNALNVAKSVFAERAPMS